MMSLEQLLVHEFSVPATELEKARTYQAKYHGPLEQILVSMGSLPSDILPTLYARLLNLPLLSDIEVQDWNYTPLATELPLDRLLHEQWLLFRQDGVSLHFVSPTPLNKDALEIVTASGVEFQISVVTAEQFSLLRSKIEQASAGLNIDELTTVEEARLRELASEAPTVNLLNSLITRALRMRASDMHVEPTQRGGKVRFRIDGVLQDIETIPERLVLPVTTRLKILSQMDIAEKRRPQDGKIEMRISGTDLDIRVSALPLNDGESVVMRFLRKDAISYDMEVLGIAPDIKQMILEDIQTTAGVILLTGPTGSGKTTSLYTFLNLLNTPGVKIITLEDPVEYQLNGINQVQVQPDIGFDFAAGLRSIVRQDPDIIMLGEIRDKETASIAMQSALTGHLVFSTVHTNDAASAYTRLLDLGVEEFLLNAALVSIVAQRLVRKLCQHCSEPLLEDDIRQLSDKYNLQAFCTKFHVDFLNLRQPKGCEHCNHTGFQGRVAVIEYLRCDDAIRQLPKDENFVMRAKLLNTERGARDLISDGLLKALQGITTLDEVLRVAG